MKNIFLLFVSFVLSFSPAVSQEKQYKKPTPEQVIEWRVVKMQNKLMLSDAEAVAFASVYKEYLKELAACRPQYGCDKQLNDEEIKAAIEARMEAKQKALNVEKKYYKIFSNTLNAKQLQVIFNRHDRRRHVDKRAGQNGDNAAPKTFNCRPATDMK